MRQPKNSRRTKELDTERHVAAKQKLKSEQQVLFEHLRHLLGCKHQCPEHLSVFELTNFIAVFTGEVVVCKGML